MKNQQRLYLLTSEELDFLYAIPQFTDAERRNYFALPNVILKQIQLKNYNYRKTSSKLYFILQFGYFQAKNIFFNFNNYNERSDDVKFIMQHYLPNDQIPNKLPTKKQQIKIKRYLLKFYGFNNATIAINRLISYRVATLAKIIQDPSAICLEVIQSIKDHKMILPSYSRLQDQIGAGLKKEEKRLIKLTKRYLTRRTNNAINNLFKVDRAFYNITELKFDPKYFKKKEMELKIKKLKMCTTIYKLSNKLLPKTKISRKNIMYYADLAKIYTVYRLKQITKELAYFYLICYVNQRYQHIVNNLIKGFIYYVDKYINNAKIYAKNNLVETNTDLEQHKVPIGHLLKIYIDDEIMKLSGKLIRKEAFKITPREEIIKIIAALLNGAPTRKELENILLWQYHKNNYRRILINLRPLFLVINFEKNKKLNNLFKAINFLKKHFNENKNIHNLTIDNCPTQHVLPKTLDCFIEKDDHGVKTSKINMYQYEFYAYKLIREHFKKYKISVNDSIDHKDFDIDIKKIPDWEKNKTRILKKLNNKILLMPIDELLLKLENLLEPLITRINERITNGENQQIKIRKQKNGEIKWTLPYPKKEETNPELNNPFFDNLELVDISDVFDFVNQKCNFIDEFTHFKPKNAKIRKDYIGIKGAILANATAYGVHLFAKRSNLSYQRLLRAEKNHIRLDTIRNAIATIVDKMIELPIFDAYNLGGMKHGTDDGTKRKTRLRTLLARHSSKYFGRDVGIVILTMHLNLVPFCAEIIGANEHESHFSFEMLHNNSTAIDPDIISTDTAGANNVNDFLYYLIGKVHAPWYRSIVKKSKNICGFKKLSHYNDLLIKPSKVVDQKKIKRDWPKLVPVLVAILSHEISQHIIVKKLSSHDYKNPIKDVLWELNNVLKSVHILKCIDDPAYRRNMRTALNRGEAYHQILDKVFSVGGGDLRGMTEIEVEIWSECARLIVLIIIYYNMYILSKIYEVKLKEKDEAAIEFLKHISAAAIQHINFGNLWEFRDKIKAINIDNIIDLLSKHLNDALNTKNVKK